MQRTFSGLPAVLLALAVLFVGALLFASFAIVFAILAPLGALAFLGARLRVARMLWASQGRLPGREGLRMVGAGRTRRLALAEVGSGLSSLALSAAPALFVFVRPWWAAVAVAGSMLLAAGASTLRRRALADLPQVEILPPE